MEKQMCSSLRENVEYMKEQMGVDENFDVIARPLLVGGKEACLFFVDGFIKDEVMQKVLDFFYEITPKVMPDSLEIFKDGFVPYVEVDITKDYEKAITNILSGVSCIFVDGYDECLSVDSRTYPARGVQEPEKDKVLRGSRDGFVETIVFNTALIRRRIRNPKLRMKMMSAGKSSKTDIVVCYMEDRVDQKFLKEIVEKIENIETDALTMNQQSLAECLCKTKWYNPFPKFKFSERPDTSAASVLEGNIVILVDNSPSAMILPTSIFDIIEEADDYYFPPITGTYLRLSRFLINAVTLILTPLFLLLMQNEQWIPEWLSFIKVKETMNIPLIMQFLVLELSVDGLRLAAMNTPSMLTTPLSVIAALVLGEFSVKSGWFNAEVVLYMAFVAVANYTQASFELGYALKFMRILTLILTFFFNVWGFAAGLIITVLAIVCNRTVSGKSYLYPLIPFKKDQLFRRFFRVRLKS